MSEPVVPITSFIAEILPVLLSAAGVTVKLTALSISLGIAIGTAVALMRISTSKPLSLIATLYVTILRGTPLMIQILIIYFALPQLGLRLDKFASAVIALGINASAYVAEIIRAAIESIEPGQMEAARSLGMSYGLAMRRIIIPQTYKRLLPPLGNEFIAMLKDTSLIAFIGGEELTRAGQHIISDSFRPWPVYLTVAAIYLCMTALFSLFVQLGERKLLQ